MVNVFLSFLQAMKNGGNRETHLTDSLQKSLSEKNVGYDHKESKNSKFATKINSFVIAASIPGVKVHNLTENVTINFVHRETVSKPNISLTILAKYRAYLTILNIVETFELKCYRYISLIQMIPELHNYSNMFHKISFMCVINVINIFTPVFTVNAVKHSSYANEDKLSTFVLLYHSQFHLQFK